MAFTSSALCPGLMMIFHPQSFMSTVMPHHLLWVSGNPSLALGLQAPAHDIFPQHRGSIFYLGALCVCSAILDAAPHLSSGQHLAMFTDNVNTVQLFNLLSALPAFNWMLIQVAMLFLIKGLTSECSMSQAFTIRSLIPCLACRMPSWQHLTRRCSSLPFNPLDLRWGQLHHESQAICSGQAAFSCCLVHGAPHC